MVVVLVCCVHWSLLFSFVYCFWHFVYFCYKQKTAYEVRISDWSSDVCSSDLKVSAFEGGIKSTLFDRRLRLNVAGFYYDYTDLQVGKVESTSTVLENAATATIYGAEVELQARPVERVQLDANAAWLHARFDSYERRDLARPFGDGTTLKIGVVEGKEVERRV